MKLAGSSYDLRLERLERQRIDPAAADNVCRQTQPVVVWLPRTFVGGTAILRVKLTVGSQSWSPEDVEHVLGRAPDEARTKGMPHGNRGRPAKYNAWVLKVPVHSVHAGDGDEGISASVVALGDDLARRLGSLPQGECTTTLVIVQEVLGSDDYLSKGIHLRVDAMRWLVMANADIDLDQYFYDTADVPGELSNPLYEQHLAERQHAVGPDHPDTLAARNALAGAYRASGDIDRAVPLYKHNLTDRERIQGPDHPDTLTARNALANAYRVAGDLERAVVLFEQEVADRERVQGPNHPDTLEARNALANAYRAAGDLDRAVTLHEQNLTDRQRVLGSDHPHTLTSRNNLANAYRAADRLGLALRLYEQNFAERSRFLGRDHSETLRSRDNLANAYRDAGDLDRAVPLYEESLADRRQILGPDHPDTLVTLSNLANAYRESSDPDRAVPPYK